MTIRNLELSALEVNRANDRHDELENETAAIAWLFNKRETHMRNLTKDIVNAGRLFEIPLVWPDGKKFIVYDGNRRVTCLKLLTDPKRAPSSELQKFYRDQRQFWQGIFPKKIQCQIETDRDDIDETLYRRHTGTQSGVGQSKWDDRQQSIFVKRTGKSSGFNVADELEKRLSEAGLLPEKQIPRSTLNRLLSAEPFRNRLGFSVIKGKFVYTHQQDASLKAIARAAHDLADGRLVLGNIWDVDGKRSYLDRLEKEGVLPTAEQSTAGAATQPKGTSAATKRTPSKKPPSRVTLIPQVEYDIVWPGRLQRQQNIWHELQWELELSKHPNAISVLMRVLLELAVENYISIKGIAVGANDKLASKVLKIGKHMRGQKLIDDRQVGVLGKFQHSEKIVSADTLNRYIHSPDFAPSPEHLKTIWDSLAKFIVLCLKA